VVKVTAIDKRNEKRASKAWKSRAMHIVTLDSSTEARRREGKSIESLEENEEARRGEREGRGGQEGKEKKRRRETEEEWYISLSLSPFLSPRGWRKLCDR